MPNKPCRNDLLCWINVVSFAVDDAKLFLDTSQVFAITIVIILLSWLTEKCLMFCLSKLCNYFV